MAPNHLLGENKNLMNTSKFHKKWGEVVKRSPMSSEQRSIPNLKNLTVKFLLSNEHSYQTQLTKI